MEDKMALSDVAVLRKAAGYMKEHGHSKGYLENDKGEVCLAGAINKVLTGDACEWPARTNKLLRCIATFLCRQKRLPTGSIGPVAWNNSVERKGEEVIAALRGTAKSIAARAG
jgi:hypothetical protein